MTNEHVLPIISKEALLSLVHWSQTHGQPVKPSDPDCPSLERPPSPSQKSSHQCHSGTGATPTVNATPTGGKQR
ncbi:MAG: hypothetical protein K0U68_11100 [Gammaproteobacteria bacterium]|nr:hypothetical protein [Gammaproteobacteria bacterium]